MTPVVSAALGAAVVYYGFVFLGRVPVLWIPWGMILLLTGISFFRVLAAGPGGLLDARSLCRPARGISLRLLALAAGLGLGFIAAAAAANTGVYLGLEKARVVGIYGTLRDDPRSLSGGQGMGVLELKGLAGPGGLRASARGKLPVFFPPEALSRLRGFGRGCEIYVEGALIDPADPAKGDSLRARSVHVMRPAPVLERFRSALRLRIIEGFSRLSTGQNLLPFGGLSLALLLGVRDNLDTEFARGYRDAGCSHVLALSGMHLAILSSIIALCLKKILGLRAAALVGAVFILLYVLLVGPQPSLVRAAIMYLLGTLTVLKALPRRAFELLALAFLLQILLDPPSGYSLSFVLSYLALAGILILGEIILDLLRGILPQSLAQSLAASLGAFIATWAFTASSFGVLRPVGILAGLFIVPLTTLFMALSLGALFLDFLAPFLTGPVDILRFSLSLLYGILERLVSFAGRVPAFPVYSLFPALITSGITAVLLFFLQTKYITRRRYLAPFD
ncbi:MAG: ComEC/Rec2 family competence protein [Treponema sp.]|jgi:competence protein ComEC|nr:ComEC/Rec2 family competence protein [Treponema sp.]